MAKKKTDPEQTEQAPVDIQNDEYRGMGGSYVFDTDTGKRTRIAGPELDQKSPLEAETAESIDPEVLNNEGQ